MLLNILPKKRIIDMLGGSVVLFIEMDKVHQEYVSCQKSMIIFNKLSE
jgi:hypothetical protein